MLSLPHICLIAAKCRGPAPDIKYVPFFSTFVWIIYFFDVYFTCYSRVTIAMGPETYLSRHVTCSIFLPEFNQNGMSKKFSKTQPPLNKFNENSG
jgi:hypothetical protein